MAVAVDHGRGPGRPERVEHRLVIDVEARCFGEGVADAFAVVREGLGEARRAVVGGRIGGRDEGRLATTPSGIFEAHVQLRQLFEHGRRLARRDALGAARDGAALGLQVFEQEDEASVALVVADGMRARNAEREERRELGVEARLAEAHARLGNRRTPTRIDGQELAEERFGGTSGLCVTHPEPGVVVRDLGARGDLDGFDAGAGMSRRERVLEPAGTDLLGASRDMGRSMSRSTLHAVAAQRPTSPSSRARGSRSHRPSRGAAPPADRRGCG